MSKYLIQYNKEKKSYEVIYSNGHIIKVFDSYEKSFDFVYYINKWGEKNELKQAEQN